MLAGAARRAAHSLGASGRLARDAAAAQLPEAAAVQLAAGSLRQAPGNVLASTAAASLRRWFAAGPAVHDVAPDVLAKARRMSPGTGLVAGLFGSVVGVGGGVVIVPLIVSACRSIPQRLVSGSSLAAVLSTALVSAASFAQGGCVDPAAAALISPVAMLTAPLGARMTAHLNCATLRRALGIFLICAAPMVPLKAYLLHRKAAAEGPAPAALPSAAAASPAEGLVALAALEPATSEAGAPVAWAEFFERQRQAIAAMGPATIATLTATGALAGFASGLLGIGGGTIVTPLLALTMPYGQVTVLGTSLLAMVPPSAAALAQHARMGNVDWRMAAGLAAGTAVGGAVGSTAAVGAPPGVLEACFSVGMLLLGRQTLRSARK